MFGTHGAVLRNRSFSGFSRTTSGRSLQGPQYTMEKGLYNDTGQEVDQYMTHVQKSDVRTKLAWQA